MAIHSSRGVLPLDEMSVRSCLIAGTVFNLRLGNPGYFRSETSDMIFLLLQYLLRNEHGKSAVLDT
jgi:hypothetical protein